MHTKTELTISQERVMRAIIAHLQQHSDYPTYRQIAKACGWTSPHATDNHIRRLIELGVLCRGQRRAYEITGFHEAIAAKSNEFLTNLHAELTA